MITIIKEKNISISSEMFSYLSIKRPAPMYQISFSNKFSLQLKNLKINIDQFTRDITAILNSNPLVGEEQIDSSLKIPLSFENKEYELIYYLGAWDNNIITLESITQI